MVLKNGPQKLRPWVISTYTGQLCAEHVLPNSHISFSFSLPAHWKLTLLTSWHLIPGQKPQRIR